MDITIFSKAPFGQSPLPHHPHPYPLGHLRVLRAAVVGEVAPPRQPPLPPPLALSSGLLCFP
jgi:hypothetical protein